MGGTMVNGDAVPAGGTVAATRVADVLLAVGGNHGPVGVTDLARHLSLSKAVVHRILQSLAGRRLLAFDPVERTYEIGPAAVLLGSRALRDHELRSAALPILRNLQVLTGETTTVSALVGAARVYLEQVVSPREIKMMVEIGRPYPLYAGSSSKAILAFVPADLREQVLAGDLTAMTDQTITERQVLADELVAITRRGVAVSRGERQHGAGSIAAPVFDGHDDVVGAISICGPINRFTPRVLRRLGPLVQRSAEEISRVLHAQATQGGTGSRNGDDDGHDDGHDDRHDGRHDDRHDDRHEDGFADG